MKKGMFRASGTTATGVMAFVGPENGQIVCDSLSYTGDAAGLLKFYRAKQKTTANAACATSTALKLNTDVAGKLAGAVLTTSDVLIIADSSGTGLQLRTISAVAAVSSGTVTVTLSATAVAAAGDRVYVVRLADIHSITIAAETKVNLLNLFNSFSGMPVVVEITGSTGSKFFSGTYNVEQ